MLLFSCVKKEPKDCIEEFVMVGYSGWCLTDSVNCTFDPTRLDVRRYFEFRKDCFVRIATGSWSRSTEYKSVCESDALEIEDLINHIFSKDSFKMEYHSKGDSLEMYDGLHYFFYYKLKNKKGGIIRYLPHYLPARLKLVHNRIDSILRIKKCQLIERFEWNGILKKEAVKLFRVNPPPPPPYKDHLVQ